MMVAMEQPDLEAQEAPSEEQEKEPLERDDNTKGME